MKPSSFVPGVSSTILSAAAQTSVYVQQLDYTGTYRPTTCWRTTCILLCSPLIFFKPATGSFPCYFFEYNQTGCEWGGSPFSPPRPYYISCNVECFFGNSNYNIDIIQLASWWMDIYCPFTRNLSDHWLTTDYCESPGSWLEGSISSGEQCHLYYWLIISDTLSLFPARKNAPILCMNFSWECLMI